MERDGLVGFKQFCTIFPHISATYLVFIYFLKCRIKLTCLAINGAVAACLLAVITLGSALGLSRVDLTV